MKVLLIDDDPLVRFALSTMLTDRGYEISTAENGFHGLKVLREEPQDVVVTDIIMPDREGLETIIEIKRDFPEVRIIAISGGMRQGNIDILPMALSLGADAVIAKPFQPHELIAELDKLQEPCRPGTHAAALRAEPVQDSSEFVSLTEAEDSVARIDNVVTFRMLRNTP